MTTHLLFATRSWCVIEVASIVCLQQDRTEVGRIHDLLNATQHCIASRHELYFFRIYRATVFEKSQANRGERGRKRWTLL